MKVVCQKCFVQTSKELLQENEGSKLVQFIPGRRLGSGYHLIEATRLDGSLTRIEHQSLRELGRNREEIAECG